MAVSTRTSPKCHSRSYGRRRRTAKRLTSGRHQPGGVGRFRSASNRSVAAAAPCRRRSWRERAPSGDDGVINRRDGCVFRRGRPSSLEPGHRLQGLPYGGPNQLLGDAPFEPADNPADLLVDVLARPASRDHRLADGIEGLGPDRSTRSKSKSLRTCLSASAMAPYSRVMTPPLR